MNRWRRNAPAASVQHPADRLWKRLRAADGKKKISRRKLVRDPQLCFSTVPETVIHSYFSPTYA